MSRSEGRSFSAMPASAVPARGGLDDYDVIDSQGRDIGRISRPQRRCAAGSSVGVGDHRSGGHAAFPVARLLRQP